MIIRHTSNIMLIVLIQMVFMLTAAQILPAQDRYALVIGNNEYTEIERLTNPVNDASDIAAKLRVLGYHVDLQINIGKIAMDRAIHNYLRRLALNKDNEGFFWFAGHGVQIDGENYLLPVDVDSTDDLSVKHTSYSLSYLTDSFDARARNKVNIVVLDACRNNPFRNMQAGTRSLSRGLSVVSEQNLPPDLMIIYSTAPGNVADDGEAGARNSPFARAFMQYMDSNDDIGIVVRGISRETMRLTNNRQQPFTGGRIIGLDYYSLNPADGRSARNNPPPVPVQFSRPVPSDMVRIEGGTYMMGSPEDEAERDNDEIQHEVTLSGFYISKTEITQQEYENIMGVNPSHFKGSDLPVEMVSWFDAIEYCNRRSEKEGLIPVYTRNGDNVSWDRIADGYRLPTEAEWEYVCRAGTTTPFSTGENITTNQANYNGNFPYNNNSGGLFKRSTVDVGTYPPNAWGLFDMHGNVWEWCWDWSGDYNLSDVSDPAGASSGTRRIARGGCWSYYGQDLRSAYRSYAAPTNRGNDLGFRVVRSNPRDQ